MRFLEFCSLVSNKRSIVDYLRTHGVLRSTYRCETCNRDLGTQAYNNSADGFVFRCSSCKKTKSLRIGSFLVDCRIPLDTFACFVYLLNADVLLKHIAFMLDLHENTIINYANLIREERGRDLMEHGEMLGGPGARVQVNLTYFINY